MATSRVAPKVRKPTGAFQAVPVDTAGMDPEMKSMLMGPTGMHGTPTRKTTGALEGLKRWLTGKKQ